MKQMKRDQIAILSQFIKKYHDKYPFQKNMFVVNEDNVHIGSREDNQQKRCTLNYILWKRSMAFNQILTARKGISVGKVSFMLTAAVA